MLYGLVCHAVHCTERPTATLLIASPWALIHTTIVGSYTLELCVFCHRSDIGPCIVRIRVTYRLPNKIYCTVQGIPELHRVLITYQSANW